MVQEIFFGKPGSGVKQIAKRAYELYLERGQAPGCELENWLQAEKELSRTARS